MSLLSSAGVKHVAWLQSQPMIVRSLIEMIVILLLVMLLSVLEAFLYQRLYRRFQRSRRLWDDVLVHACHRPLQLAILVVGISYCVDVFDVYFPSVSLVNFTLFVRQAVIIFVAIWACLRFARMLEANILDPNRKYRLDKSTAFAVNRLFKIGVFFVGVIAIMQLFGVPLSGLIAFGGAGALAFSFAAKDSLSNVFGGLMLYIERPFSVGDWVMILDKNIEGTVGEIGWRSTRITNFDQRPIFVPNSVFTTSSVMNCTRMTNRRMVTALTLRYQDAEKIGVIRDDIYAYLKAHAGIDQTKSIQVFFNEMADSSINIRVAAFTLTKDTLEFGLLQQEIFLKMMAIVKVHDADFAFPTQTFDVPDHIRVTVD